MTLVPSKIGGSPKQYAILGVLVVVLAIAFAMNRTPAVPAGTQPAAAFGTIPAIQRMPAREKTPARTAVRRVEEFRPTMKLPEGTDVTRIDPTIRLDLLAKVHNVPLEAGPRGSVFAIGQPPPPPPPTVIIDPKKIQSLANATPKPNAGPPPDPPKPQAPPVPFKFYGYSTPVRGGPKRAFFLDGDDITVVSENDVIKNRYKIVSIGVNSVVVEDLNFKSQQKVPLVEELPG